jgi:hypothetical protein
MMDPKDLKNFAKTANVLGKSLSKQLKEVQKEMTPEQRQMMRDLLGGKKANDKFDELTGKIDELSKAIRRT